ncbi:MAG: carboxypeptidase regulatory-like domain-containing protein [Phycisphaerales bacterium]|jgi:iron complex outermembrane receptor protein|nr:carboxypeptidase regulatory-like domain-containing protein [Phycisphaerales bacterium]
MTKRNFLSLLIAAIVGIFMLATPNTASAQPAPGKIVGTVVDADGKPVADAHVVLKHGDKVVAHMRTNAEGHYAFKDLRPGRYLVQAGKAEVGRGQERAAVRPGETVRVRITLKKK